MGTIPVVLGLGLATGAMVALSLTLIASVRRRRHDLALLKTLGFKRRQLAAAVAWQASVTVAIGTIVGIPIGIVVGRALWDAFADQIDVVAQPFVPALAITAIGLGALVLANLVAAVPGRVAARTPTALLLRAD
jgi:ABC-type lipoprotein release transport system permease subunit